MNDPELRVSYTAKELLGRIDNRLESIERKLDGKADQAALTNLETRVELVERRMETRDAVAADAARKAGLTFSRREKLIALGVSVFAIVAQPLLTSHHHLF